MTFQPWIPPTTAKASGLPASFNGAMTFQHMDTSRPASATRRHTSFNGAMTFQPWIPQTDMNVWQTFAMDTMLQWSHDLSAMDTRYKVAQRLSQAMLQWSHDLSAMDTRLCRRFWRRRLCGFNGAMTFQPWIRRKPRVFRNVCASRVYDCQGCPPNWHSIDRAGLQNRPF